ncbi:MAG: indolepyruvate oxidoreductase [Proteobacteria bacterium]|nr:indolepyruvate oxidoreductase [Pseudomonadota bacterium]
MDKQDQKLLMGNEAIGRGLVETGCTLVAAYPGTPSSEVLGSVVNFKDDATNRIHIEWSINEKVAYETALASSQAGKRSAVIMKQVGLNVAADPFTRSAYLGVKGGLVVVVADDPGPHSSQTEQDSRLFAHFAKVPVFDPSSPAEAKEMVAAAFDLSEQYEIPVLLRPTTRICHSRQNVPFVAPKNYKRRADFKKDPGRWVATPAFLTDLHRKLNRKIDEISKSDDFRPVRVRSEPAGMDSQTIADRCVVSSGVAFANAYDLLMEMDFLDKVDLYQAVLPFPLNKSFIKHIGTQYREVLILEETYSVMEMQLAHKGAVGRISGDVVAEGELTPDVIHELLVKFLGLADADSAPKSSAAKGKPPSLCAGCSHRASFHAIKQTFPKGIFPSDIGCYTLGMNLGAVDTCHCMGACISQGAGFYRAYAQDGDDFPTIVVTIGDSTFLHAGIPALINAVVQDARIIIAILDNSTTAMTGFQPTPQEGIMADGSTGKSVSIPELVKACGVEFLEECDPFDRSRFDAILKEADQYCRKPEGGLAVVISKHPCLMDKHARFEHQHYRMAITDDCTGCRECVDDFECPALFYDVEADLAVIDVDHCSECGVCVFACSFEAITREKMEEK